MTPLWTRPTSLGGGYTTKGDNRHAGPPGSARAPRAGGPNINSKWSYSLNGLYQVAPDRPWGFKNAALNLTGRQG